MGEKINHNLINAELLSLLKNTDVLCILKMKNLSRKNGVLARLGGGHFDS